MLYVGQFSFDVLQDASPAIEYGSGSFTGLVEAGSAEEALEKFRDLIGSVDDSEPFESVGNVYLDVGIEVRQLPADGLITYLEMRTADGAGRVSMALPDAPAGCCSAFDWVGESETEDEEYTPTPFMPLER